MDPLLQPAVAFCVAATALYLFRRTGRLPVNLPNERSLHDAPVPRGGGLAIWLGWFSVLLPWHALPAWLPSLVVLIVVSLLDDRFELPVGVRLLAQVLAAAYWVFIGAPAVGAAWALIAVIWATNLYNFMDGSDGLSGFMTVTGFTAYAVASWLAGNASATSLFALVAATLPFLRRNFPPATVFLGDAGAVPLGFLAAVVGIDGISEGLWPLWFPLLVFLPFIADATVTLGRRALRGERVWQAHREHYYQRLVRLGLGHVGALALYAALMVGTATSALAALVRAPASGTALLAIWVAVHLLAFSAIDHAWRRSGNGTHASKC